MSEQGNLIKIKSLLLQCPNWKQRLQRHLHKFVQKYIDSNYSLYTVSRFYGFSENDMLSIFKRVEDQLEKKYGKFITVVRRVEEEPISIDGLFTEIGENKISILKEVLQRSSVISNLEDIFTPRLYEIISSLLKTKDIEKTAEELQITKKYLVEKIVGRKNPRKPSENGALYYLNHATNIKIKTKEITETKFVS